MSKKAKKSKKFSVKFRHKAVFFILKPLARIWIRAVYRFKPVMYGKLPAPCFVVSNHVTDCDMIMVPLSFRGVSHMYFVAGEHAMRAGFASKLLKHFLDPIARFKGTTATSTVLEMLRRMRAGASVALFPEGARSFSGETGYIFPATASLARKSGVNLVTYRIEGGYLTAPRWAKGLRKGKMTGRVVGVYTPEQLKAMTDDEVMAIISRDIYENAFDRQRSYEKPVRYKCAETAKHIERAAIVCPKCKAVGTVKGEGSTVSCTCGMKGTLDEYGFFDGGIPFETMAEWFSWQSGYMMSLPEHDAETELCRDGSLSLNAIDADHNKTVAASGSLVLTTKNISVGERKIALDEIVSVDTYRHGYLLFTTADGTYYEIRGEGYYEGYKYYLYIKRYGRQTAAKQ